MSDIFRRLYGISVKAAADGGSRAFDVIASTDDVDLDGEVMVQDWDLRRYQQNPVILYFHNLCGMWGGEPEDTLPVGFATNVAIQNGKLVATLNFVDEKASDMAERCYQGFIQKSLRAVSVGFRSKQGSVETRNGQDVYVLRGNELLEISVCPIPINPNSVTTEDRAKAHDALRAFVKSHRSSPSPTAQSPESEDMKTLAKALGLKDDASEAEILAAINALSTGAKAFEGSAKTLEGRLLTETGAKSVDEAFGVIKAGTHAIAELGRTTAALAVSKAAVQKRDREALVGKGVADKKLTPALRDWALATKKAADGSDTGEYVESLETIASFLKSAPTISALPGKTDTKQAPTEAAHEGAKPWEEMTPPEKHDLSDADPATYKALREDWERRGKPAMKYGQPGPKKA